MNDFLGHLAARALQSSSDLQPQRASRFEPPREEAPGRIEEASRPERPAIGESLAEGHPDSASALQMGFAARLSQLEALLGTPGRSGEAQPAAPLLPVNDPAPWGSEGVADRADHAASEIRNGDPAPPIAPLHQERGAPAVVPLPPAAITFPHRLSSQPPGESGDAPESHARSALHPSPPPIALAAVVPRPLPPAEPAAFAQAHLTAREDTAPEPAPRVVQITIGRLEIRATPAAKPARAAREHSRGDARAMSLGEFLRQRTPGGGAR